MSKENIPTRELTSTTEFPLRAGMKFTASVSGDGSLQFGDGAGNWEDYPDTGTGFGGWVLPCAKVRVLVNTPPVAFGLVEVIENNA